MLATATACPCSCPAQPSGVALGDRPLLLSGTWSLHQPVPTANSPLAGDRNQQCPVLVRTGKSWRCLEIFSLPPERARAEVPVQDGSTAVPKFGKWAGGRNSAEQLTAQSSCNPQILSISSHFIYEN